MPPATSNAGSIRRQISFSESCKASVVHQWWRAYSLQETPDRTASPSLCHTSAVWGWELPWLHRPKSFFPNGPADSLIRTYHFVLPKSGPLQEEIWLSCLFKTGHVISSKANGVDWVGQGVTSSHIICVPKCTLACILRFSPSKLSISH